MCIELETSLKDIKNLILAFEKAFFKVQYGEYGQECDMKTGLTNYNDCIGCCHKKMLKKRCSWLMNSDINNVLRGVGFRRTLLITVLLYLIVVLNNMFAHAELARTLEAAERTVKAGRRFVFN